MSKGRGRGKATVVLAVATALAACYPSDAAPGPKLPCARGHGSLAAVCTLTRERTPTGEIWTVRHPDGGFRRLLVEGNEVSAADGAEPLRAEGDEVVIGDERYRLPDE